MTHETIAVVIPVFNCANYIAPALESVLSQTVAPAEILVVDDGSTDGTKDVVRSFGNAVTLLALEHQGSPAAKNSGILAASSQFLSFIDADDLWPSNRLELLLEVFHLTPSVDVAFGMLQNFVSPELPLAQQCNIRCPEHATKFNAPATMLITRSRFLEVGLFDEGLRKAENLDWMHRAQKMGLVMHALNEVTYLRRLYKGASPSRGTADLSDYLRVARSAIARSKNQGVV